MFQFLDHLKFFNVTKNICIESINTDNKYFRFQNEGVQRIP